MSRLVDTSAYHSCTYARNSLTLGISVWEESPNEEAGRYRGNCRAEQANSDDELRIPAPLVHLEVERSDEYENADQQAGRNIWSVSLVPIGGHTKDCKAADEIEDKKYHPYGFHPFA